jgi:hypothetical protein
MAFDERNDAACGPREKCGHQKENARAIFYFFVPHLTLSGR